MIKMNINKLNLSYLLRWYYHPRDVSLGALVGVYPHLNPVTGHPQAHDRTLTMMSWGASEKQKKK